MNKHITKTILTLLFVGIALPIFSKTIYVAPNVRLPSGYQECDYIESIGTQYINTGVMLTNNFGISCRVRATSTDTLKSVYGNDTFEILTVTTGYRFYWVDNFVVANTIATNWNVLIRGPITNFCNDTRLADSVYTNLGVRPLHLFASQRADGLVWRQFIGQISHFSLSQGGVVEHDYVPALRTVDSVAGMYDLVNNTFMTNGGTGSFTYQLATTGTSWDVPYTNLQTAVTASIAGDLILVTNGTYAPITTGNKAITIQSVNGAEFTTIDGGGTNRCATLGTGPVLDGFTLINGGSTNFLASGGGSYYGTIKNCFITNCFTHVNYYGGGSCNSYLFNTTITGCWARDGGGVYGGTAANCIIRGNSCRYNGGGTRATDVVDCRIYDNTAPNGSGGGVYTGNIYDSIISNNIAGMTGGGIYNAAIVSNCTVIANAARFGVDTNVGGGINTGTIIDSRIIGNFATNGLARGGGVVNATVRNCYIYNNRARAGGGTSACTIYDSNIVSNSATYSDGGVGYLSSIYNSTVEYNTADSANGGGGGGGGGITSLLLSNCVIRCNSAPIAGGIGGATLKNCIVSNNTATIAYGGGLNGCVAIDSLIAGNYANTDGGGVYGGTSTNCIIRSNTSLGSGGGGFGGYLYNCLISDNTASRGGGTCYSTAVANSIISGNTATIAWGALSRGVYYNCTIVSNSAPTDAVGSPNGSITNPKLFNCIVWGNYNTNASVRQLQIPESGNFNYSIIDSSNSLSIAGSQIGSLIGVNPQFVNSATNDFRLKLTSPCINRGANQYVTTTTDFAGSPRIKNQRVDIGAYEVQAYRDTMIPNGLYPMGVKIGRLPAGYTECAYLESTGTQWIDAGIATINTNSSYKIDFTVVSVLPTTMYGVWGSYNDVKYCGYVGFGMPLLTTYYGGNGYVPTTNSFPITMVGKRVVWNQNRLVANYTVDGTGYTRTYTATDSHTTNDFRLFSTAGITDGSNTRIYSFSYLDGNTLARRFIPALDVYGTPCMYDTVTKTPFYNQGTGEFLYQIKGQTPIIPIAWYKLDGNALDSSGNGYNGSWSNTASYATGKFVNTRAANFDGTNYVYIGKLPPNSTNTITICAWINAGSFAKDFLSLGSAFYRYDSASTIRVYRSHGAYGYNIAGYVNTTGEWSHIAVVIDPQGTIGFQNGTFVGSSVEVYNIIRADSFIAKSSYSQYAGLIQDVRIYNRALSTKNIRRIMQSQDSVPIEELQ